MGSALDLIKVNLVTCKWTKMGKEDVARRREGIQCGDVDANVKGIQFDIKG